MGGRVLYSSCFVSCCLLVLVKIASSIHMNFRSSFLLMHFVIVNVVHPYSSMDTATAWEKSRFILSDGLNFHMMIAFYASTRRMLTSLSVDKILLSTGLLILEACHLEWRWLFLFKKYVLCFIGIHLEANVTCSFSRLCSRDSAWIGVFARRVRSSA